jgi:hypothetical protein
MHLHGPRSMHALSHVLSCTIAITHVLPDWLHAQVQAMQKGSNAWVVAGPCLKHSADKHRLMSAAASVVQLAVQIPAYKAVKSEKQRDQ